MRKWLQGACLALSWSRAHTQYIAKLTGRWLPERWLALKGRKHLPFLSHA